MTIQEIKDRLSEEHPHQYKDKMIIEWVNDVERELSMFLRPYEGIYAETTEKHDDLSDTVMLEETDLYVQYLIARICLANEEYDRYNTHSDFYNARLQDWKDRYIRAHEPINRGTFKL